MRNIHAAVFALILTAATSARAQDPATAVDHARAHITAKQFAEALNDLNGALEGVERLKPSERAPANAAIHFYAAVAFSGLKADVDARAHLVQFFALTPNARLIAETYDPRFVALFNDTKPRDENAAFRFETFYPGFGSFVSPTAADQDASTWVNSSGLVLLASPHEKRDWQLAVSSSDRARFIEKFWKRRDPTPATPENEFRDTFNHRVAFADKAFASADERGSSSDRGRVFVLLGVPSSVRRRPLTQSDRVIVLENSVVINGTVEQWVYTSEQLPIRLSKKFVGYRFITQKGIGDNVLQREDPYAFQALMVAMNPNEQKNE